MALLDIFRKKNIKVDSVHATVYAPSNYKILTEQSKGQIVNTKVRFPKELGEAHPFDFKLCEDMTKKIGLVNAIIDKHVDFIMSGGMTIKAEDDRAKKIIDDFMTDFQFDGVIRNFLKETYIKGTGFLELSYGKEGKAGVKSIENMKVLNSNYMYINRDDKGEILGYRQYIGMMKEFGKNPNEVTDFAPEEIACLTNNKIGDCAYGTGMVFPLIMLVDDLAGARKEMHMLMKRKANTPIIFTGGNREKDEFPTQGEMDSLGERLEWLTNKHEWVVSDFWKASTLDFGNVGDKFKFVIDNDMQTLFMAAQVPEVLMGGGSIPEGLAQVQMEAFMFRITSLREECEKIIEDEIFKRVLNANGLDVHVEVVWGIPTDKDINNRIVIIKDLLNLPLLSNAMRDELEFELATLMELNTDVLETAKDERAKEENQKQPLVPGQNAAVPSKNPIEIPAKPKEVPKKEHHHLSESWVESFDDKTVREWTNYNYSAYTQKILDYLYKHTFPELKATTKQDIEAGLLKHDDIVKLRSGLSEGFEKNQTMREISNNLKRKIDFKDRLRTDEKGNIQYDINDEPLISVRAENRPIMIARTETIRAAREGSLENYRDNGVEKVRWVAALSDRTCDECAGMNGEIYTIDDVPDDPHPMCRCAVSPVVFESKKGENI